MSNDKIIVKDLIGKYAHDYRDMKMSAEQIDELLWNFWGEIEKDMRVAHLEQFISRINSHGFIEWYLKH